MDQRGRLLTSAQVAALWRERATEMGYPDTRYSRYSVRARVKSGGLVAAQGDGVPNTIYPLYWECDAREIALEPQKSRDA